MVRPRVPRLYADDHPTKENHSGRERLVPRGDHVGDMRVRGAAVQGFERRRGDFSGSSVVERHFRKAYLFGDVHGLYVSTISFFFLFA